jgi:hypothetical protein
MRGLAETPAETRKCSQRTSIKDLTENRDAGPIQIHGAHPELEPSALGIGYGLLPANCPSP